MKVNQPEFIQLVSEDCDYYLYEVEDVLVSIARVINQLISEGKSVNIRNLGEFQPKLKASRAFLHPQKQVQAVSKDSVGVRFRPNANLLQSAKLCDPEILKENKGE